MNSSQKNQEIIMAWILLLKCIFPVLVYPFVFLVNLSFESGVVPDFLKLSNIIPLHKTGDD